MDDIDPKLKAVLDYVAGKLSDDQYVRELDAAVAEAKHNREWRREYMTLEMKYKEKYSEGRKEERIESIQKTVSAISTSRYFAIATNSEAYTLARSCSNL